MIKQPLLTLTAILLFLQIQAGDSTTVFRQRKTIVAASAATLYSGSMLYLYHAWYKNYEQSAFHFYNDNNNWMLADKAGHTLTSYQLSRLGYAAADWAGYSENQAIWIGGATGFAYQTVIEILDGFSEEWGASPGDLAANTLGSAIFIGQQKTWGEQKFLLKFSYHSTRYPQYRPNLLGNTKTETVLKDYNGHTFWLSGNIKKIFQSETFPPWLNMAIGYNAHGMTGASENPTTVNGKPIPPFDRSFRFLLSPDISWEDIPTSSSILKTLYKAMSFLKAPAPALEYDHKNGWHIKLLFF